MAVVVLTVAVAVAVVGRTARDNSIDVQHVTIAVHTCGVRCEEEVR